MKLEELAEVCVALYYILYCILYNTYTYSC